MKLQTANTQLELFLQEAGKSEHYSVYQQPSQVS